ncbi:MAG: VTT domain-containing protein [Pseudomonadota bacterium]
MTVPNGTGPENTGPENTGPETSARQATGSGASRDKHPPRLSSRHAWLALAALAIASGLTFAALADPLAAASLSDALTAVQAFVTAQPLTALMLYAALCLLSQALVVPNGSLLLLAAGLLLGALPAAAIFFAAQLIMTAPLFALGRAGLGRWSLAHLQDAMPPAAAARWRPTIARLRDEGILLAVLYRLTPVLPSAIVCLAASATGLTLRDLLIGTALAGWVRPLLFASLGETAARVTTLVAVKEDVWGTLLLPLSALFIAALALLAWRVVLRRPTLKR